MAHEASIRGFTVGCRAELTRVITGEDVRRFVEMTGDNNPLHVDREFAKRTPFKDIVVHGMLGASFISTLIGKQLPGEGALWLSQSLEFLLPVRMGDCLTVVAEVVGVSVSQSILGLKIHASNQHGQDVLVGESKVKVLDVSPATKPEPSSSQNLKRVVILCGGSGGIGAETAELLGERGYSVVINYLKNEQRAFEVARRVEEKGGESLVIRGDVSCAQTAKDLVRGTVDRFGAISGIVHAATDRIVYKPFDKVTEEDLQRNLSVNLFGAFHLFRESLPYLEKSKMASVVTIGTINSDSLPAPQLSAYTPAKAALTSLTKCLAMEYGSRGIRFNIVSPGATETSLIGDLPEKARMLLRMQTPLRRLAEPKDVAEAIVFLLAPESRHITGETLRVCGGAIMV